MIIFRLQNFNLKKNDCVFFCVLFLSFSLLVVDIVEKYETIRVKKQPFNDDSIKELMLLKNHNLMK